MPWSNGNLFCFRQELMVVLIERSFGLRRRHQCRKGILMGPSTSPATSSRPSGNGTTLMTCMTTERRRGEFFMYWCHSSSNDCVSAIFLLFLEGPRDKTVRFSCCATILGWFRPKVDKFGDRHGHCFCCSSTVLVGLKEVKER